MANYTNKAKADAARREVEMRRKVYPNWVAAGRMKQAAADLQIAIMEEIAAEYRLKAEHDESQGRFDL